MVDVLVNGNLELANETAQFVRTTFNSDKYPRANVRVWFIKLGDKAHAFNQYLHMVWPQSKLTFFVDGYVRVHPQAFKQLDAALMPPSDFLGASGVPTVGRTAGRLRKEMLENGGIHGNLFALKGSTVEALREINFKLPLGLYRTDPTLGATLCFGMNPSKYDWEPQRRIFVHPDATWAVDEKNPWKFSDLFGQLKRVVRQGQGILENRAVRNLYAIQKLTPEHLPATTAELVFQWANTNPGELRKLKLRHPLLIGLALRRLSLPRDWSQAETPPDLIAP